MHFTTRHIAGVPALVAYAGESDDARPLVLWFHGLGVDKETHRAELQFLAEAGFLAVGVDAVGHGERRWPHLQQLIDAPRAEAFATAVDVAVQTANEVPGIIDALILERLADPKHIALAGISMGAFTVYRALADRRGRAGCAVAILGSPRWPFASSPHNELDAFCDSALLSITAELDENVPPTAARELHYALERRCPEKHRYVELSGAVHLMSASHWEETKRAMLNWLNAGIRRS
jgi:uncharacterized protein